MNTMLPSINATLNATASMNLPHRMIAPCSAAVIAALALLTGQALAATTGTLVTVNGIAIPQDDLEQLVRASGQPDTPVLRQTLTRGLVARELIRQAARREHLDETPVVRQAVSRALVDTENRLYIAQHARPQPVTDDQVRARYDAITREMGDQEYQVRVLTFADEPAARAALLQMQRDATPPGQGSAAALPWISFRTPPVEGHTAGLPLALARTVASAPPGEAQLVPLDGRMAVVRVEARRPVTIPPYSEASGPLRAALEAQAREAAFSAVLDALAAHADIVPASAR
ncbi:peptidylprolyl isomerase [Paraburkholderia kururiensis]|uniref:peptidylprolyl isomerase n=1 Tax=Paraburkholderia kururiensis TaxID=984307 RepID=UPI001F0C7F66|nr:peptidylprolyl isomerase [Paraburkholderia kururiensis]